MGIHNLRLGHYVRVGQGSTEMYYGPGEVASQHTLSGEAAEDVGDVVMLEIAPRGGVAQRKRRRQEVACSRREVQRRIALEPQAPIFDPKPVKTREEFQRREKP